MVARFVSRFGLHIIAIALGIMLDAALLLGVRSAR